MCFFRRKSSTLFLVFLGSLLHSPHIVTSPLLEVLLAVQVESQRKKERKKETYHQTLKHLSDT